MVEGANEGMLILTGDGKIIDANPAAERLFGADAGALLGREIHRFATDPDTCTREWHAVTATDRHRGTSPSTIRKLAIDGSRTAP
jgi:PAS domain S-box-containing protein